MQYEITTHEVPEQAILSIRERRAQGHIPAFIGEAFGELFERLELLGIHSAGPPFVIYHDFGPDGIDAEVCVLALAPSMAGDRIEARVLPSRTVARTLHIGPYENLGSAYAALTDWVQDHGFESSGPMLERYLNGPGDHVAPSAYRTEIEQPVVMQGVAVTAG